LANQGCGRKETGRQKENSKGKKFHEVTKDPGEKRGKEAFVGGRGERLQ